MSAFGISFSGDRPAAWLEYAKIADESGFWGLGVGDSPSIYPDTFVHLGVAAIATSNVHLGPWVTNPLTRHPVVTAGAIATVDELSGGRAFLGIGTGFSAALNLGVLPAHRDHLERYVRAVRELLQRGETNWEGQTLRSTVAQRGVPIYVAGSGPKALELAGRCGDGVVLADGVSPEVIESARSHIAAGARASGRDLSDVPVRYLVVASLADDDETALEEVKASLVSLGVSSLLKSTTGRHVPSELEPAIEEMRRRYDAMGHATFGPSVHADLCDELGLTEYLAERYGVVGGPDTFVRRCRQVQAAGAEHLWFAVRNADKRRFLRLWNEQVRDKLN